MPSCCISPERTRKGSSLPVEESTEQSWFDKVTSDSGSYGQKHLAVDGVDQEKLSLQLAALDKGIPGGLSGYIERSKKLLHDVKNDVNPLVDYTVSFAEGIDLSGESGPGCAQFEEYEKTGMEKLGKLGFVLVAGGLGERLGYPGIKVEIPTEMTTKLSFLNLYCKYVLACEAYANEGKAAADRVLLPLCIMTSGDTHEKTVKLLAENNNFGLKEEQLFLMQQDKVPAFSGAACEFVLNDTKDGLETKPHGHGDVHTLMYMKGIAKKWLTDLKLEYVLFFQDTNPLAFRALASCLGVSVKQDFAMNSLTVPRKAGEAAGAIVQLLRKPEAAATEMPEKLVINVEYNLLGGLLAGEGGDAAINENNDSFFSRQLQHPAVPPRILRRGAGKVAGGHAGVRQPEVPGRGENQVQTDEAGVPDAGLSASVRGRERLQSRLHQIRPVAVLHVRKKQPGGRAEKIRRTAAARLLLLVRGRHVLLRKSPAAAGRERGGGESGRGKRGGRARRDFRAYGVSGHQEGALALRCPAPVVRAQFSATPNKNRGQADPGL